MTVSAVDVLKTAVFDLDLEAREYRPAIEELIHEMAADKRVLNAESFRQAVLQREDECSTSIGAGVSFPHARTAFVGDLILAVGRSREGIAATDGSKIHLVFLVGTPKTKIQEYLTVVGFLARNVKQKPIFEALIRADAPEAFIQAFSGK